MGSGKSRRRRGKRRRSRACGSKKAYSRTDAVGTAITLTKKTGTRYNAYKCLFCYLPTGASAWHVGHAAPLDRRLR